MKNSMTKVQVIQTSAPKAVEAILKKLLVDTFLTAIYYAAGFCVEFSRTGSPPAPTLPMVVWLTMRSQWWVGEREKWEALLHKALMPYGGAEPEEPVQAYALMCLNGARIENVALHDNSTLTLVTSYAEMHLSGKDDTFEESWIFDVPPEVPNHELWSVVCSNTGELFGRQPVSEKVLATLLPSPEP